MIKDLLDEKSSISSMRFAMFIGIIFSIVLTLTILFLGKDPSIWIPVISMFFLGGVSGKVLQKGFELKANKENGGE